MRIAGTRTKIVVGAFVLALIALAVVGAMITGDGLDAFKTKRHFQVTFRDASGLQEGASVKMGGLTVGRVTSLTLAFVDNAPAVVASIDIIEPHFEMVRIDSVVRLETQGVLGDKFVAVVGGTPAAAIADDNTVIATMPQLSFDEVAARADKVLTSFGAILVDVRRFSSGLPEGAKIEEVVRDLTSVTGTIREASKSLVAPGSVFAVAADPANGARLEQSLAHFDNATGSIAKTADRIEDGHGTLGLLVNDPSLYDGVVDILGKTNRNRVARFLVREALKPANGPDQPTTSAIKSPVISH